jgi:hypothetical protein
VQNVRFIVLILLFVRLMVFNAIFNNISVISWQSVLLVKETGVTDKLHPCFNIKTRGRRGRDRMVVGFTPTYAISAYHH